MRVPRENWEDLNVFFEKMSATKYFVADIFSKWIKKYRKNYRKRRFGE